MQIFQVMWEVAGRTGEEKMKKKVCESEQETVRDGKVRGAVSPLLPLSEEDKRRGANNGETPFQQRRSQDAPSFHCF